MTITGRQIRDARGLLGLQRNKLAARAKIITTATSVWAESVDGEPPITSAQAAAIRVALDFAGIEFTADLPGVRLRPTPSTSPDET